MSENDPEIGILVNEADETFRHTLESFLRGAGFGPIIAATHREVIPLLEADPDRVQLLITNAVLSEGNGLALAAACRKIKPDLQVIYVSSESRVDLLANHDLMIPSDRMLRKPFDKRELKNKIAEVLAAE